MAKRKEPFVYKTGLHIISRDSDRRSLPIVSLPQLGGLCMWASSFPIYSLYICQLHTLSLAHMLGSNGKLLFDTTRHHTVKYGKPTRYSFLRARGLRIVVLGPSMILISLPGMPSLVDFLLEIFCALDPFFFSPEVRFTKAHTHTKPMEKFQY